MPEHSDSRLPDDRLAEIKRTQESLRPMWEHLARAEARLKAKTGDYWYFALLGFDAAFDRFDLSAIGYIQRVEEPPDPIFLIGAADSSYAATVVGRYCRAVKYEFAVERRPPITDQQHFTIAWQVISALRARSLAELLVPAASDHPWATIAGVRNNSCKLRPIEDVPQAKGLGVHVTVTTEQMEWVNDHFIKFSEMLEVTRFRIASEALSTHHLQHSDRMMAAHIWAGIEALLDVQHELRFRLSALVAAILEDAGPFRLSMYKKVQKLYDIRSKIVHGASMQEDAIRAHTIEARSILSRLMCHFVERGRVLDQPELEAALFGVPAENGPLA